MVTMKKLGSREEWLQARSKLIGGSDAACVLGLNPWKSNTELWEEKTGKRVPTDIGDNEFVKYGHDAEPHIRALFALDFPQYEVFYEEDNIWTNDKYPFAHASLDGWMVEKETGRKGILEIKTTNILQSMQKEKWNERIPDNYFCQCMHYLMVTEFDFVILKAQLKSEFNGELYLQTKHYLMNREDFEEDIEYLKVAEQRFYENIVKNERPPFVLPQI